MEANSFKLFSLFSGAGGMDLGFARTNKFQLLLANDVLTAPAQTYAENFKHQVLEVGQEALFDENHPTYFVGDVSQVDFGRITVNDLDVMVGGPPCQDFSVIRGPQAERQGLDVKRGRLYAHFVRALIHLQPKAFVFENVPGLKSANNSTAYRTILDDFSRLNLRWKEIRKIVGNSFVDDAKNYLIIFSDIVDSANLGVPQRRKRLIIIGVREDLLDWTATARVKQKAEVVLLGRDSLLGKYPLTPIEVFEGQPFSELRDEYSSIMKEYQEVADTVATEKALAWRDSVWNKLTFDVVKDYLAVNAISPASSREIEKAVEEHVRTLKALGYYKKRIEGRIYPDGSNIVPAEAESVLERQKMIPPDQNHLFVKGTKWEVEGRGLSLIYRRIHPLKPSYTVVAYGGGGTWGYHYKRSRGKLTHRERARLQTFPEEFRFEGNSSEVRAQLGEAVPPRLGQKIAEIVQAILAPSAVERPLEKTAAERT
jgi:DNA (cytosine-5)-methyltransferase 1